MTQNSIKNFESYLVSFKENRENVINVIKILLEQKKSKEFKSVLLLKGTENSNLMREFVKNKYYDFVECIGSINDSKNIIQVTDEVLNQLENYIQVDKF
jgi:hypothetical protein